MYWNLKTLNERVVGDFTWLILTCQKLNQGSLKKKVTTTTGENLSACHEHPSL
jgi:hypothetical protein